MKTHNSEYMKYVNKLSILNILRQESVSRAELARRLGLTRAAITLIIDRLIKDEIVIEKGISNVKRGRKPILLGINPKCYYAIGIDISRHAYSIGIVNIGGEVIAKKEINYNDIKDTSKAISIFLSNINKMVENAKIESEKILGIGVTSPGPIDINSGMILNPPNFKMWHNYNIKKELENKVGYKVQIENISKARAIVEKQYGVGKEYDSFILIVVDEGIGSGIVIGNEVYHGKKGFGSEFGHTSINFKGRRCSCGNRGCVETYAAIPNILNEAREKSLKVSSWKDIVEGAEKEDDRCIGIVEKEAIYLSSGIVNIINLLELEAVVIAGEINYKPNMLLKNIKNKVSESVITRDMCNCIILESLIEEPEVIAPASVVIEDFFKI